MMLMPKVPTLSEYWQKLEPHLPPFSPEERRVALALYREVAKGQPADDAQLGRVLGISATESRALLQRHSINFLVHRHERGHVLRCGGLPARPRHYPFEADARLLP